MADKTTDERKILCLPTVGQKEATKPVWVYIGPIQLPIAARMIY